MKRYIFCALLLVSFVVFGVTSFASGSSGDRFFVVDENGHEVVSSSSIGDLAASEDMLVDSGVPPITPVGETDYSIYLFVIVFMLALIFGSLLCMIFFDRL